MLNNLVIDCVSGYVSALYNFVGGFCTDMAHCWSGSCHVHVWRSSLLAGGTSRGPLAVGTVFEALRPCFCEFGQMYMSEFMKTVSNLKQNLFVCLLALAGRQASPVLKQPRGFRQRGFEEMA